MRDRRDESARVESSKRSPDPRSSREGDRLRLPAGARAGLRLPPFGKELCAELERGRSPNVRLFCDRDAWVRADQWRIACGPGSALVLPHDADPEAFRWPAVDGLLVIYREGSPRALERKQALAMALIRDGVGFVLLEHLGKPIVARAAQGGA